MDDTQDLNEQSVSLTLNLSSALKRDGKTTLKRLVDTNLLSAVRFGVACAVSIFEFSYKAIK